MDVPRILSTMSFDQLINYMNKRKIVAHSKQSRVILFSDIMIWIRENDPNSIQVRPNEILRLDNELKPDRMVSELAREIGLNLSRLEADQGFAEIWLLSVGIQYLTRPENIISAVVYYLYETKTDIPREWTYHKGDEYKSIFQLSLSNFRELNNTFSDETIEEWILVNIREQSNTWTVLEYQTIESLQRIAKLCPQSPHYQTKIGLIFFIGTHIEKDPPLYERILQELNLIWSNSYEGRKSLVSRKFNNNPIGFPVSYPLDKLTLKIILALPPNRLEKIYCSEEYNHVENNLQVKTKTIIWKLFVDPNIQINLQQLNQIVSNNLKSLRSLSDRVISDLTSVSVTNDNWSAIQTKIGSIFRLTFRVERNTACINTGEEDYFGDTIANNGIYITYGNIFSKKCYTFNTIRTLFWDSAEERFSYRQIDNIDRTYDSGDIIHLILELRKYKIRCHLSHEIVDQDAVDLEAFLKFDEDNLLKSIRFTDFSANDRQMMIRLMNELFDTGMYQRRWCGRGNPYVMSGFGSGSVDEIASRMTVSLNNALDIYNSLSQVAKDTFQKLPVIREGNAITSRNLYNEFASVRSGSQCTALAQGDFILSADFYARQLGGNIAEFRANEFKAQAEHYQGDLPTNIGQQTATMTNTEIQEAHAPPVFPHNEDFE